MIVDAVLHPADLPFLAQRGLAEAVCVVFDVLRATSSMVTALEYGVAEIIPAASIEEAFVLRTQYPHALLGGERHGDKIGGFDLGNSPMEYRNHVGATVIATTTNGTIALKACEGAATVLVGAVVNISALVRAIETLHPKRLLAICSGTGAGIALEDAWAAGALVEHFQEHSLSDEARMALALRKAYAEPSQALRSSKNGTALLKKNRGADIDWCEVPDRLQTVGILSQGSVGKWEKPQLT